MTRRVSAGPTGPARRVVLAVPMAAPTLLAAACTGGRKPGGLTPAQVAAVDQARERAVGGEQELIARYDAALLLPEVRANQALADRLAGVRAEHVAHVAALREGTKAGTASPTTAPPSTATPSSAPPSAGAASGTPSGPATASATPPMDAKAAVAGLVRAEQDAATRLTTDVMATEGHTAQLLASISAAESGHAALLLGGVS